MDFVKNFLPVAGCWWGVNSSRDARTCQEWLMNNYDLPISLESDGPQEARLYSHLAGCYFNPATGDLEEFVVEASRIAGLLRQQVARRITGVSCADEAMKIIDSIHPDRSEMLLLFKYVEDHNIAGIHAMAAARPVNAS